MRGVYCILIYSRKTGTTQLSGRPRRKAQRFGYNIHLMLISLLILVLSCPDMVMVYAFYVLLQGVLVNVIVNQNNTI